VDIKPIAPIKNPVTLKSIKAEPTLQEVYLVRNGRLSVMPLEKSEYEKIMEMGS
jgi:predicted RNA-binding protein with PUA-like domain